MKNVEEPDDEGWVTIPVKKKNLKKPNKTKKQILKEEKKKRKENVSGIGDALHDLVPFVQFNCTHFFPINPFSTPRKHWKTLRFSDVFRGPERVHWEQMG